MSGKQIDVDALLAALDDNDILLETGIALNRSRRFNEARFFLERLVARDPKSLKGWFYLGLCIDSLGRPDEAMPCYRRAGEIDPGHPAIQVNLGTSLENTGHYDEALECYQRAVDDESVRGQAGHGIASIHLRRGDYAKAWPFYEYRTRIKGNESFRGNLICPEWRGEPLAGKRLLVLTEQGAGDLFQFVRYARVAADLGATVDVMVSGATRALIARADGVAQSLLEADSADYDYWINVMSFGSVLGTQLDTIPGQYRYIHSDEARRAVWQQRIDDDAKGRLRVGIAWAGNPTFGRDARRSIPLDALSPLWGLDGIAWFSLQKGRGADELATNTTPLIDLGSHFQTFDDTAAAIDGLDLVIAVDTSIAHLAGALGKTVWVLPYIYPDWRWLEGRSDSPWYPSARLFRQRRLGDWTEAIEEVRAALAQQVAADV
ncbi:tetratricopeptide repeat protein [Uliginosibacterium sp. sgz301328]|uniref:tetratricopeptide repeat-containing glycosyltransferase family protein n=1 Tax=Uliginosibacterium sp. sgz301328 TaxID=3243764 RepID=UPI00359E52EC